ncbi:hypothetical protein M1349_01045 [Patescibacteria group bacterium]|nr:hypothetical protein [Patescibacteria group bacterium]
MKKEKTILSFAAVFIGLIVAGIAFYIFQLTKTLPPQATKTEAVRLPTQAPKSGMFLAISEPANEVVLDSKTVKISGKTLPGSVIIVATKANQEVIKPTSGGDFSTTVVIQDGVNIVRVTAISANGEEKTVLRTVSFTSEDF